MREQACLLHCQWIDTRGTGDIDHYQTMTKQEPWAEFFWIKRDDLNSTIMSEYGYFVFFSAFVTVYPYVLKW